MALVAGLVAAVLEASLDIRASAARRERRRHAAVRTARRPAAHDAVDGRPFRLGRHRDKQAEVHQTVTSLRPPFVVTADSAPFPSDAIATIFSTRIAVALNSAVPDFGSVASIVSTFVSTWSGKWNVMNASPRRSAESIRAGARTEPRREVTCTIS